MYRSPSAFGSFSLLFIVCILLISSCKKEIVPEEYIPTDSHVQYINALNKLDLSDTALGQDWIDAAEEALSKPMRIESPYVEHIYFSPTEANSVGYLISLKKGQKINIEVSLESNDRMKSFLDIYRVEDATNGTFEKIASSENQETSMDIESRIDTDYIIRFQTELLRGGNFKITVQKSPSLDFPVSGKNNAAIGSLFGVPRDGGRRKHHGIDIFAKRHTPIIAPTDGYIRFAGETGLGGTVIWMRDQNRRQTLYFAHLQKLLVQEGQNVAKGDTIGTVGNTGNARTTPPHLHFGIYQNGPIDPYHHVAITKTKLKRQFADKSIVNQTMRTNKKSTLRLNGTGTKEESISLQKHQILEVLGATSSYFRVQLPNESVGYISFKDIESVEDEVNNIVSEASYALLDSPSDDAHSIKMVAANNQLTVLGSDNEYKLVKSNAGLMGWIRVL